MIALYVVAQKSFRVQVFGHEGRTSKCCMDCVETSQSHWVKLASMNSQSQMEIYTDCFCSDLPGCEDDLAISARATVDHSGSWWLFISQQYSSNSRMVTRNFYGNLETIAVESVEHTASQRMHGGAIPAKGYIILRLPVTLRNLSLNQQVQRADLSHIGHAYAQRNMMLDPLYVEHLEPLLNLWMLDVGGRRWVCVFVDE